ncbi:hypothetical protein niasHT_027795 [Heterodera trifolii]|uniref:BTB domain-containing protein n=1 Tax=Heterodera trifolii TaxID=157864 RepID=A0ABD2JFQ7_9BILA
MAKPDTLAERMKLLLSTGNGADVYFLVGEGDGKEHLIAAHKLILMAASEVFESMFRFDAQNTKNGNDPSNPIVISDITSDVFETMLSFIYTDNLSAVNGENVAEMLYAAKKYNVTGLVKTIRNFNVSELRNVFRTFAMARLVEEEDEATEGQPHGEGGRISADDFLQIDQKILCEILECQNLAVNEELSIWNAALRWADAQCHQSGKKCSEQNRRAVLGPALFKIRFSQINRADFYKYIVPADVLTVCELDAILDHFRPNQPMSTIHNGKLQFPTNRRSTYDDPNKAQGMLTMQIEMSELHLINSKHVSKALYIQSLPWRMAVCKSKYSLRFYAQYDTTEIDLPFNYKCPYTATVRIVSQKEGKSDYVLSGQGTIGFDFYHSCYIGHIQLSQLILPNNGWYCADENAVKVTMEVETGAQCAN